METNKTAMTYLKKEKFDLCFKILTKAENKLNAYIDSSEFKGTYLYFKPKFPVDNDHYNNAASVTYNNIGCYYQK